MENLYVYSASTNAFYPKAMQSVYEAAGTWPTDAVDVTDQEAETYMGMPPLGQMRAAGPDGHPTWVDLPPPTLADQAQALLAGNLTVQCTDIPSLDGDYAIDANTRVRMNSVVTGINAGLGLPSGGPTFNWPDAAGNAHTDWPADKFTAFAHAGGQFAYQCNEVIGGFATTLPSSTIII